MSQAEIDVYSLGRMVGDLEEPFQAADRAFGSIRLDGRTIWNGDFQHCTFANISFKEVTVQSSTFLDCVFIGCYFRRAELVDSSFIGCRFIDCHFGKIAIKSSRFGYSSFRGCQLPFEELRYSFPPEPNVREELARNLYLESSRLGLTSEARLYRMIEIRAREDHLGAAILGRSQWYREHFDALGRVRSALSLSLSLFNRWLWGYGERAWVLIRNLLALSFVVFPVLFYLLRDGLIRPNGDPIGPWDSVIFSLENMVPAGIDSDIQAIDLAPRILAGVEAIFGVVVIALFASYIFRWSLHR